MIKKQGITVSSLVITIIILTILAGTITISTLTTISYSKLSSWANELLYIQEVVDEQNNTSSNMDYTMQQIELNIPSNVIDNQFDGENISEDNKLTLKILDLGKLKITNTIYGNLSTTTDVYAISENTGKVYYVQGVEIEGQMYYSLTDSLRQRFNLISPESNLSSVVFVPSIVGYSNEPITVVVKVPKTYTNIIITTSNDEIQIGTQTEKETTYEYTVNTNKIEGNYVITVSYNNGAQSLATKYEMNSYDITLPTIQPLDYYSWTYKELETETLNYITNVSATDASGIKIIKYALGTIGLNDAQTYFKDNGNVISNGRINLDRSTTIYTLYAEDNAGNFSILTFDKKDIMPENWKENVSYVHNTVPIPKGFVVSPYKDEISKNGGIVIYELDLESNETSIPEEETQYESWTTRNQYVWVPVARNEFVTQFVRRFGDYNTNTLGNNYWEVVLDKETNMPIDEQDEQFVSATTKKEVKAMYESVKKYGGFYIARYEAGIDKRRTSSQQELEEKVYSMMGKFPYTMIIWGESMSNEKGGSVEASRSIYPADDTDYSVVSTLIYGVQWDTTLQWWLDTKAVLSVSTSTSYGNYKENEIKAGDLNEGAKYALYSGGLQDYKEATGLTKDTSTMWCLTTGALKAAKVNNIYDMAGNVFERTMEGYSTNVHCYSGGSWYADVAVAHKTSWSTIDNVGGDYGFRVAVYIK